MNIIISRYCIIKDRARGPYKENWKRRTSLLNAVQSSSGERTQQNTDTPADQDGSRYLQRPSLHPATLKIRNGFTQWIHSIPFGGPATDKDILSSD